RVRSAIVTHNGSPRQPIADGDFKDDLAPAARGSEILAHDRFSRQHQPIAWTQHRFLWDDRRHTRFLPVILQAPMAGVPRPPRPPRHPPDPRVPLPAPQAPPPARLTHPKGKRLPPAPRSPRWVHPTQSHFAPALGAPLGQRERKTQKQPPAPAAPQGTAKA